MSGLGSSHSRGRKEPRTAGQTQDESDGHRWKEPFLPPSEFSL